MHVKDCDIRVVTNICMYIDLSLWIFTTWNCLIFKMLKEIPILYGEYDTLLA